MTWTCSTCGGDNPEGTKFCGHCGATTAAPEKRDADVADALRSFVSGQVAERLLESGGDISDERRLVTALFADLSGFTPLAERLDPEQLLEVIDPVIERLTNIVGKYEGYVDKFAGDALLAFFGAPVAHEDDAQRALLVALEMHKELQRMLPELPEEAGHLTLHVGVNSGHVIARVLGTDVRMDYSVLGDAVILAQRLESAAPAGETYVGTTTHLLTRDRFEFESVGELTLKGKAEPVTAWRLAGKHVGRQTWRTSRLVGRHKELESLTSALDSLKEGRGAVISVSGEPGLGKSRLTDVVRERAQSRGLSWLPARCVSYGAGIAYYPFSDLIRRLVGLEPAARPAEAVATLTAALETAGLSESTPYFKRLLGLHTPELAHLEPEAYRRRLHEALADALRHLSKTSPVVVAIEDLHWADGASIALTTDLASVCQDAPIALYLTARMESVPVLIEIAAGAPETIRYAVQLEPMGAAVIGSLVENLLGCDAPAELVDLVSERSTGNPFFAEEILRTLRDSGGIVAEGGTCILSKDLDAGTLPPTIEGVLSSRIDLLPRRAATLLQVASVIGRRVRVPLLQAVESDAEDVDPTLRVLVDSGFLDPTHDDWGELIFHHALVQDVAYARLLRRQRRTLHRRVAKHAERLYGKDDDSIDLLARHLYLGAAGAKAIDYLVLAAERAKRMYANEEAIMYFDHALEVASSDVKTHPRIPELSLQLADLQDLRGNYDESLRLYTDVRDTTNDIRAWRGMAASLRNHAAYGEAIRLIDQAFASSHFEDRELAQLWLERAWILAREGNFPQAIAAARDGLRANDGFQDPVLGQLLLQLTRAESMIGNLEQALEDGHRAVSIFENHDDVRGLASALRVMGHAYRLLGLLDEAAEVLQRGLEIAEQTGNVEELGGCLINLGLVEFDRGRLEEAIACDRRAIEEFERIDHVEGRAIAYVHLGEKLVEAGAYDEALARSSEALTIGHAIGHTPTIADAILNIASVNLRVGNFLEAAEKAEEAAEAYRSMNATPSVLDCLDIAAQAWEGAGERERAREVRSRARSLKVAS